MKKISIELSYNELIMVQNYKYKDCSEVGYFWQGILIKHRIASYQVDIDSIVIDGNICELEYLPMRKSDLC